MAIMYRSNGHMASLGRLVLEPLGDGECACGSLQPDELYAWGGPRSSGFCGSKLTDDGFDHGALRRWAAAIL